MSERPVVAITGGAGGIGRALAQAFGETGARVALLDLDADALQHAAAAIDPAPMVLPCDITDADACQRAIDAVVARYGRLDILVNNAGISHISPFSGTDLGVIRKVMDVNFFGAVYCTSAALDAVVAAEGQIVALSSVAGFAPLVGRTGYSASKHAMHGFFDSLRAELAGTGVNVMLVCPAWVASGMRGRVLDGAGEAGQQCDETHRQLTPDQVAHAIVEGCRTRRRMLILSPTARASWWISRLAPTLYERLMRRRASRTSARPDRGAR